MIHEIASLTPFELAFLPGEREAFEGSSARELFRDNGDGTWSLVGRYRIDSDYDSVPRMSYVLSETERSVRHEEELLRILRRSKSEASFGLDILSDRGERLAGYTYYFGPGHFHRSENKSW